MSDNSEEKSKFWRVVDSLPDPDNMLAGRPPSDRFLSSLAAFQRMPDAEFSAIAEECFLSCGVPRNASGRVMTQSSDSHEAMMHYIVIPELIKRLKRLSK